MALKTPRLRGVYGWRGAASVLSWLFAQPWQFDFFQAVRLLEFARPETASPGESVDPALEVVHLAVSSGMATPASEVQSLASPKPGETWLMRVNFSSLAGPAGPLPYPDTEQLLERSYRKDHAMRDFLDIFHHRLLGLIVRVKRSHLASFTSRDPSETNVAAYLFALMGLGMYPGRAGELQAQEVARLRPLRNRLISAGGQSGASDPVGVPDRALLHYAGILTAHPRSASGLERFLADYFGTPCTVKQLSGIWRSLDPGQWTRIGAAGQNAILGQTAMAGTRIWDQQGAIELYLGPMKLARFVDFLPFGKAYASLCRLMSFYAGPDLMFRLRLGIEASSVPPTHLLPAKPVANPARLGWTSWLRTRPLRSDDSSVVLSPAPAAR
jgi:type VI secretion system protein ImpH